jgi:hypothetical protein
MWRFSDAVHGRFDALHVVSHIKIVLFYRLAVVCCDFIVGPCLFLCGTFGMIWALELE